MLRGLIPYFCQIYVLNRKNFHFEYNNLEAPYLNWYYDQKKKLFFPLDFKTFLTKH